MSGNTWVAANFSYDDGKLYWLNSPRYNIPVGSEAGCSTATGYWEIGYKGKHYLRHRMIYALHTGEWPDLIDHKDQDTLNDRFENLRPSNKILNGHNSDKWNGDTPFRGVSLDKRRDKFHAYLTLNRKRKFIGYFNTAEEASHAYENYRKEVVGCLTLG